MVHSGQYILRMESVPGSEFSSMGLWETSVGPQFLRLAETEIYPFRSRRGKKRFLVRQISDIPFSGTYHVGQLHHHRGR